LLVIPLYLIRGMTTLIYRMDSDVELLQWRFESPANSRIECNAFLR
jgi:hypothetical protein